MKRISLHIFALIFVSCTTVSKDSIDIKIKSCTDVDIVIDWIGDSDKRAIPFCISSSNGKFLTKIYDSYYKEDGKIIVKKEQAYRSEEVKNFVPKTKFSETVEAIYSCGFTFSAKYPKDSGLCIEIIFKNKSYYSFLEGESINLLNTKLKKIFPKCHELKDFVYHKSSNIKEETNIQALEKLEKILGVTND